MPKDRLKHLAKLADDRWREYEHKTQAEWRFSFGIWAVLLGATATLLNLPDSSDSLRPTLLVPLSLVLAGLALVGHWALLWWINARLAILRKEMKDILNRRRALLDLPTEPPGNDAGTDDKKYEDTYGRSSIFMQLFISVLAAALVIATAILLSLVEPEASDAIYGSAGNSAIETAPAEG